MKLDLFLTILSGSLPLGGNLSASLSDQVFAYYDFEQTGTPGLANKVTGSPGTDAIRYGGGTFDSSANPSGPGFAGQATFTADTSGTSTRGTLLAGKALNLSDDRNDAIQLPYGPTQLGGNFSISAWHFLAPGAGSTRTRFHLFESSDVNVYDISWGTANGSKVNYLSYLNTGGASPGVNDLALNAWHHVVHTFSSDGTTTTLTVYVDGVSRHTQTALTAGLVFTNINVGRARDGTTGRNWDGMVDELGVWKRALTAREVQEINARGRAGVGITTDLATVNKAYIDLASTNPAFGSVTGTGIYNLNDVAPITTTGALGYTLTSWSGAFAGKPASFSYTVTGSVLSDATFGPDTTDTDGDGLTNYQEVVVYLTNPTLADTDGDTIPDGAEVTQSGTNPLVSDSNLVNFVNSQFLNAPLGTLDLTTGLTRNPQAGTVALSVKARVSTNNVNFTTQSFNASGATVTPEGDGVKVALPTAAGAPPFYRLLVK